MAGVLAVSLVACTFGTTGPPSHPRPDEPIECTDSYGAPIVEATVGALVGGYGLYLAAGPSCPDVGADNGACDAFAGRMSTGLGSLLLVTSLVFLGGSVVGFSQVSACKQALAERRKE